MLSVVLLLQAYRPDPHDEVSGASMTAKETTLDGVDWELVMWVSLVVAVLLFILLLVMSGLHVAEWGFPPVIVLGLVASLISGFAFLQKRK